MLDLDAPTRRIAIGDGASLDLALDADDPLTFYVPPGVPRLALDDSVPRIQLYRFIRDGKLERGQLDLQIELGRPSADALDQVRAQLQAERTGDHRPVRVVPLPVIGGQAELIFIGSEATADGGKTAPHARVYAKVTPALDPPFTTTFSVPLDPAQVALVEAAMRSGAAPVGIVVRLSIEGLLPAQRIVAHVDWRTAYKILSSDLKEGYLIASDDVQRLAEQLIQQQVIRIDVIQAVVPDPSAPSPPATNAQLAWIEKQIVETCCKPVLPLDRDPAHASFGTSGEMFGVGESYVLKDITEIERDTADIDLQTRTVAVRTLVVSAHLADLLGDAPADAHITDGGSELPYFARARLHVTTARPLAATFVSDLIAHFHYGQADLAIHLAQGGAADGAAETWADQQPDHTWSLPIDVTIANDAPVDPGQRVSIPALTGKTRELTLDLEQLLGIYSVEVTGSPDPRVTAARVDFTVLRAGAAIGSRSGATVTAAAPKATAWFRDVRDGDRIQAMVTHLLADGRILQVPPIAVETRALRLPPAFPGTMTVQLFADADWTGLDRVTVALQKSSTAAVGTVVFAQAGASASVSLDLPDPLDRSYRYRCVRTLAHGEVEEDDWLTTDHSVLLVGRVAANMLVVDVTPQGLELPDAGINFIEVDLEYVDARNRLRSTPTAEIHALADVYHWTVALKDPSLRSYRYRITVHRITGATEVKPWTTSSDRILLVPVSKT